MIILWYDRCCNFFYQSMLSIQCNPWWRAENLTKWINLIPQTLLTVLLYDLIPITWLILLLFDVITNPKKYIPLHALWLWNDRIYPYLSGINHRHLDSSDNLVLPIYSEAVMDNMGK